MPNAKPGIFAFNSVILPRFSVTSPKKESLKSIFLFIFIAIIPKYLIKSTAFYPKFLSFTSKSSSFGAKAYSFGVKANSFRAKEHSFIAKANSFGAKAFSFRVKVDSFEAKSNSFITKSFDFSVKAYIFRAKSHSFLLKIAQCIKAILKNIVFVRDLLGISFGKWLFVYLAGREKSVTFKPTIKVDTFYKVYVFILSRFPKK